MRRIFLLLILSFFLPGLSYSSPPDTAQIRQMKKVQWLVGKWNGEGWISAGGPQKHFFSYTQNVEAKFNGLVLTLEGVGVDNRSVPGKSKVIHQSFVVLNYDIDRKTFRLRTYSDDGVVMHADATVDKSGSLSWDYSVPPSGKIRFTIKRDDEGGWVETGEVSRDLTKWIQNVQINLKPERAEEKKSKGN